jgi:hypothetical protein
MREQKRAVNLSLSLSLSLRRAERKKETPNARGALAEEEARRIGVVVINSSSSFGDHFSDFRDPKIFIFFFLYEKPQKRKRCRRRTRRREKDASSRNNSSSR